METQSGRQLNRGRAHGRGERPSRSTGGPRRLALWSLTVVGMTLAVAPVAFHFHGAPGMVAAASAAAVCFGAAAVGGMIFKLLAASEAPVAGLLLALGARITAPLAACVVIHLTGGPLAEAGFAIWTLVFYPVALAVSTWSEIEAISRSHSHAGRT